jgi:hypothetical protein
MTGLQLKSRSRSLIAIVAGICLLFAIVGFWALRSGLAASDSSPPVAAPGQVVQITQTQVVASSKSALGFDQGSSSTNQKSLKSSGVRRDRPPTRPTSAPPQWLLPTPKPLASARYALSAKQSPAYVTTGGGQELLNLLCIARR